MKLRARGGCVNAKAFGGAPSWLVGVIAGAAARVAVHEAGGPLGLLR
jgi:hypothetical protein